MKIGSREGWKRMWVGVEEDKEDRENDGRGEDRENDDCGREERGKDDCGDGAYRGF